ncbi:hypothetical protein Bca52824_078455 [Brassica carinata]|uniref:Cyclin-dependent kinase inhibitor domain-containing protein n=1 Tax=Brassica carinata TaxID=52824 RepID=A0A8X7U100_BRACI|nr:hypothetical protein Bca52824_078455 [Brassica carinata]
MVRKCRKAKGTVGASSTYMQLRSRRIVYRSEKASSSSSCCASNNNGVIDLEEERDGETETSSCRRKGKLFENLREKESSKSMENSQQIVASFDSAGKESSDCCCSRRASLSTTEDKGKPTAVEIEEFFVEAEKQLHDKFKKKYNFDFEKEKPLEGRYEWVKLSE